MLRKRARSIQKGQQITRITRDGDVGSDLYTHSDISLQRQKITPFLNAPNSLFIGLTCMGVPDSDSLTSPTSPLDFKLFSTSNSTRLPKPYLHGHNKCWVCSKVGLCSIVGSLDDGEYHQCDNHNNNHVNDDGFADEDDTKFPVKNSILFGSQVRSKTPNSPTNDIVCEAPKTLLSHKVGSGVLFEIGGNTLGYDSIGKIRSFSFDSKSLGSEMCRLGAFVASGIRSNASCTKLISDQVDNGLGHTLDPSEIEQSEDYTCVISHGPNPKTTHIFGDCVLGCHLHCENKTGNPENGTSCLEIPCPLPPTCLLNDFLSYCNYCKKKLEEGKDIYMYRGEEAFCSWDCRLEGISIEEQKEHSIRQVW